MECEFCGKPQEPLTVQLQGREFTVGYKDCNCSKAQDARMQEATAILEAEKHKEIDRLIAQFDLSGIPKRYTGCEKLVSNSLELYQMAFKEGLYIFGGFGTGKTTTAAAIGIRAIKNGKTVRFIKAYNIPQLFFDGKEDEITYPDLLIIDDLGADMASDWSNTKLRAAIDDRYDSMKQIIVTSNYSKTDLMNLIRKDRINLTPHAILSRLSEMTVDYELKGQDRRVRANS